MKIIISLLLCLSSFYSFQTHAQWSQVNVGSANHIYAVQYLNSSSVFFGGVDGLIKSSDAGNTWTTLPLIDNFGSPIYGSNLYSVHFFDANNGVATGFISTGNSEVVLRTTNGGTSWTYANVNNNGTWPRLLNDLYFTSSSTGFAVGSNGRI